jgi:hypothetical protein
MSSTTKWGFPHFVLYILWKTQKAENRKPNSRSHRFFVGIFAGKFRDEKKPVLGLKSFMGKRMPALVNPPSSKIKTRRFYENNKNDQVVV